jgi:hypothetical protein
MILYLEISLLEMYLAVTSILASKVSALLNPSHQAAVTAKTLEYVLDTVPIFRLISRLSHTGPHNKVLASNSAKSQEWFDTRDIHGQLLDCPSSHGH